MMLKYNEEFLGDIVQQNMKQFCDYDMYKDRLDEFFGKYLEGQNKYESLWHM